MQVHSSFVLAVKRITVKELNMQLFHYIVPLFKWIGQSELPVSQYMREQEYVIEIHVVIAHLTPWCGNRVT